MAALGFSALVFVGILHPPAGDDVLLAAVADLDFPFEPLPVELFFVGERRQRDGLRRTQPPERIVASDPVAQRVEFFGAEQTALFEFVEGYRSLLLRLGFAEFALRPEHEVKLRPFVLRGRHLLVDFLLGGGDFRFGPLARDGLSAGRLQFGQFLFVLGRLKAVEELVAAGQLGQLLLGDVNIFAQLPDALHFLVGGGQFDHALDADAVAKGRNRLLCRRQERGLEREVVRDGVR